MSGNLTWHVTSSLVFICNSPPGMANAAPHRACSPSRNRPFSLAWMALCQGGLSSSARRCPTAPDLISQPSPSLLGLMVVIYWWRDTLTFVWLLALLTLFIGVLPTSYLPFSNVLALKAQFIPAVSQRGVPPALLNLATACKHNKDNIDPLQS